MLLEVRNLTKIYTAGLFSRKSIVAVDNVSFDIDKGKIVSLVGESGSGKTTIAKIILKLEKPTSGKVFFEGKDIETIRGLEELRDYYRKVHGILQDPYSSFNPFHKVDRVLKQALNLLGSNDDSLIREALREVGLRPDDVLGKYPHELSGGMRQRIMIARCYILKPRLILADEPVTMLDASTRAGVIKLFVRLRENYGSSVVFITHDLGLAYYVSDEILIMHRGSLVERGTPDKLLSNPEHPYTRKLLEDIPLLYRKWEL